MNQQRQRIGFIGLGLMGQAFTRRLTARGYAVTGYDLVAEKIEQAAGHGVAPAATAAELTAASDLVLLCVTSTDAVEAAVFGPGGVVEAATPDRLLVDHSTTIVGRSREMAGRLAEATGMAWVDAPVSGGPPAAEAGSLAIMAGGDPADIARAEGVMADLAAQFSHMGPSGAGQVTKMINQVLVLNNFCVLAEALALAEAGGIDAGKIPEALAAGHAGSNLLQAMFPRMIARDFAPAGYARQILKDLDMVQDLARELKVPTPMSSQAASLFRILNSKGHAELDGIAVLKLYDRNDTV
ncbi:MAG: NAD(P)-dependent oxidoreductase [Alphaproteobacteria bacterium]|jgi:3-hydroxyisobutyrate dehydrogenase-like beta-hydroxyacid dehydrogenase|nr:NAD(P)-dependent oxidoreductase [Alphaproteobacteria bacterium]MDP6564563.1 NAD(P)-dependent oxidoreductase [Alphaproteobacteria bacterium]MDP6811921.1 NAD(P)-dependent oxidoreductase [Alphaproteobacteria bacterium]